MASSFFVSLTRSHLIFGQMGIELLVHFTRHDFVLQPFRDVGHLERHPPKAEGSFVACNLAYCPQCRAFGLNKSPSVNLRQHFKVGN
jgi:hypothetical protein